MESVYVLLGAITAYAFICTLILVHARYRFRKTLEFVIVDAALNGPELSVERKATMAIELVKAKADIVPWYEKAVSTIGVAGFISMIIATGIQTGDATAKRREVDELKVVIGRLEKQRTTIDQTLKDLSAGALQYYERTLQLDGSMRTLLDLRRTRLLEDSSLSLLERGELMRISMTLRRVEDAATQVAIEPQLLTELNAVDANSIAEYLIWTGNLSGAQTVLKSADSRVSTLTPGARARYYAMRAFLDPTERGVDVASLSAILKVSRSDADQWMSQHNNSLISRARDFKEAALCTKPSK